MDFRILGRLEALDGGVDLAPRRAQPRALLAMFLLHPNELLTTDRLVGALWGDTPPATADKALQGHVSTLRKALGHERLVTERGGYRLTVHAGELDADRFGAAVGAARAHAEPVARARALSEALASWRGDALADLAGERFVQAGIARLATLRLTALELWADAEVEAGSHVEVVADLDRAVAEHPLSEGLRASLMRALYRAGRQSDALRTYREGRRHLAEELGIDPGAELQLLERQILAQDPALNLPVSDVRPPAPRQERKPVTVLVAEVMPAAAFDPEDLERAAQPALARIRSVVERVGGRAEPLFANALIGMFGAPRAHDDDPVRAVRAALELLEAPVAPGVELRGGIETGDALVTIDGASVSITGQVLGLASRLQATASVGVVLVGPATHRVTEQSIEYAATDDTAWIPRRLRRAEEQASSEPPFVGRADELGQLERIVARAREGRNVQLVTISAEPGGGKSRLVRELRARLEAGSGIDAAPQWLQGRCLPYGSGLTFRALGEVVKDWSGILESDGAVESAAKLGDALAEIEPDESRRAWLHRNVAPLAGIEDGGAIADREQGFVVWRQLIEAIATRRPLVVAFEDIHWADDALIAFIDHVVEHASGVALVVLCTARPELLDSRPTWGAGKRNATAMLLQPLSELDTGRLLQSLLGAPAEPAAIRRAGGNPLFALELARATNRPGTESAPIPETLQAVIAARLDTLAPDLKVVAANASVVGEEFWSGVVAEIGGVDRETVDGRLHRLVANDVIRRRRRSAVAGEDEYEFLHVLVRDVAYGQIPRRDRIAKHQATAGWVERLAQSRPAAHAELAAHHYAEALRLAKGVGDDGVPELQAQALAASVRAGDGARLLDVAKAAAHYGRALALMSASDPGRGDLLARLGDVTQLAGDLEEAERITRSAIDALLAVGDGSSAAAAMVTLESVGWRLGRPESERRALLREAVRLLEALPPSPELVHAYAQTAAHELYAGLSAECLAWSSRALALAQALGIRSLEFQPRHYLGIARFEQGDVRGIDDVRAAITVGLDTGLGWETAHALADLGAMVWLQEGPEPAMPLKAEAAAFAESRGMTALAETTRAQTLWMQYDAGLWDDLLADAARLVAVESDRRGRVTMMALSATARVLVGRGRLEEASALESDILGRGRAVGDSQDVNPSLATTAYVRSAAGDVAAALALIGEMEERSRGHDLSRRAHDLALVARVCLALGAPDLARSFLPAHDAPAPSRAKLAVATTQAVVAEAAGDLDAARRAYAAVAREWASYGFLEEEAHALLGEGRCVTASGSAASRTSLGRARRLGRSLGALEIVREASRLLGVAVG